MDTTYALALFPRLIEFQLLVRRLTSGVQLTLSQSQALGEIASRDTITAGLVSERCRLEKSTVSRLLSGMQKAGLIEIGSGRNRALLLTPSGKSILEKDDLLRSAVSKKILDALQTSERKPFISFFKALADGFGIEEVIVRDTEHALRPQQRRLSQAFGLLKDSFLGSGFTSLEVHLLKRVEASAFPLTAQLLERELPYSLSTISRAFQSLERREIIQRTPHKKDHRNLHLCLTEKGKYALSALDKEAARLLSQACSAIGQEQKIGGLGMLDRILGAQKVKVLKVEVQPLLSENELYAARAFAVKELIAQGLEDKLPGALFPKEHRSFKLSFDGATVGVCSLRLECGEPMLEALLCRTDLVTLAGVKLLITESVRQLRSPAIKAKLGANFGILVEKRAIKLWKEAAASNEASSS